MGLHRLIHKGTSFKYFGQKLNISLSLGLFSSNEIDAGSSYLLKSLASEISEPVPRSILDVGCGTGVLSLALKKRWPVADVTGRDRDALACRFTQHNAQVNSIEKLNIEGALFLEKLEDKRFDLIVSNIPAKAGEQVIAHFLSESVHYCTAEGRVAVVVVQPLRDLTEKCLSASAHKILFQEHSKMYSIFHFQAESQRDPIVKDISLYVREHQTFEMEKKSYQLDTVHNIPDFDQISWKDQLMPQVMKGINRAGTCLILNPGQGHFLCWFLSHQRPHPVRIYLLSRDLLQLETAEKNALSNGFKGEIIKVHSAMEEDWMKSLPAEEMDFCHFDIQPVTRSSWEEPFKHAVEYLVKPGGIYSWLGKSGDIQSLMKNRKGSQLMNDKKYRGWRGVILRKKDSL